MLFGFSLNTALKSMLSALIEVLQFKVLFVMIGKVTGQKASKSNQWEYKCLSLIELLNYRTSQSGPNPHWIWCRLWCRVSQRIQNASLRSQIWYIWFFFTFTSNSVLKTFKYYEFYVTNYESIPLTWDLNLISRNAKFSFLLGINFYNSELEEVI